MSGYLCVSHFGHDFTSGVFTLLSIMCFRTWMRNGLTTPAQPPIPPAVALEMCNDYVRALRTEAR